MKEKIYQELCHNYRYFLTWRHAAFAGNFLAIDGINLKRAQNWDTISLKLQ